MSSNDGGHPVRSRIGLSKNVPDHNWRIIPQPERAKMFFWRICATSKLQDTIFFIYEQCYIRDFLVSRFSCHNIRKLVQLTWIVATHEGLGNHEIAKSANVICGPFALLLHIYNRCTETFSHYLYIHACLNIFFFGLTIW